jgi:hypothetical protein
VAIEYPLGLPFGPPGDRAGQLAVLRATLAVAVEMEIRGEVRHLPFKWPASADGLDTHPPEPPPIVGYLMRHPWHLPRLFSRDVPE